MVLGIGGFMWTVGSIWAARRGGAGRSALRIWARCSSSPRDCLVAAQSAARQSAAVAGLRDVGRGGLWRRAGDAAPDELGDGVLAARAVGRGERRGADYADARRRRGGALMGAVLNAIGSDPDHLRLSITAIFGLAALIALFPATWRPMSGPSARV